MILFDVRGKELLCDSCGFGSSRKYLLCSVVVMFWGRLGVILYFFFISVLKLCIRFLIISSP